MKIYNNLWGQFTSKENFELAYKNAIKGKGKQKQVKRFKENAAENLELIRQSVINGTFHTSEYKTKTIYEPKQRIVYKLPFAPDRIVQHAIMNVLKPILLNKFINNTYACIEGRGQHKASIKCSEYVRKNKYCLKGDIYHFYPSINQEILSNMLHRIIKDARFMDLLDDIIFSYPGGYNCPIGNYCSQWFGNFYLMPLDNFVKHNLKCKSYERFCDDFLLFSNNKDELREDWQKIIIFLKDTLELKTSHIDLFKTKQGVDFCGYRHFGKYVLLRKSTAHRMKRRLKRIRENKELEPEYVQNSIASMQGWLAWCCSYNFRMKLKI